MSHTNNGKCSQCAKIFDRYPNFHSGLRRWFEEFQSAHPEAHISCAGRGEQDQEADVIRKVSRAHFGQSAHNYGAAIDIFEMQGDLKNIYERSWFDRVLKPSVPQWLNWYGAPQAPFPELPHVELRAWKDLAKTKELRLIEEAKDAA